MYIRIPRVAKVIGQVILRKKGFEVEQYTGLKNGQVLPLSAFISQGLANFSVEPDQRNIEFITPPLYSYDELFCHLISNRMKLRAFLKSKNSQWTVVPSSTLSMPFDKEFIMSKPEDAYHQHIKERHGLSIITTSVHYNIGIDDAEEIIRLTNLMRAEVSLILALSASSPFYDGQITGNQSYRWVSFPKVPIDIPFFDSVDHFAQWTEQMLEEKQIFNVRHFWGAVRPNGMNRPRELDRLEIRIADISTDWNLIMAIMAWLELRVNYFLKNPDLKISTHDSLFLKMTQINEMSAAINGMGGSFSDWLYEEETSHFEATEKRLSEMQDMAKNLGIESHLKAIETVLIDGNEASQKLEKLHDGYTISDIMEEWIVQSEEHDLEMEEMCKKLN